MVGIAYLEFAPNMISLEHIRRISPLFKDKSDEELTAIRTEMEGFAQLAIEAYKLEMVPKNLVRLLAKEDESGIITKHD